MGVDLSSVESESVVTTLHAAARAIVDAVMVLDHLRHGQAETEKLILRTTNRG